MGLDISLVAVNAMNKAGFLAEKRELPPINSKTKKDLIVGLEILEHLDDDKRLELIKEVSKTLEKDGTAIFSVPDNCMPPEKIIEHRTMFDLNSLLEFLKKAFKNVTINKVLSKPSHIERLSKDVSYLVAVCSNKEGK
jgi:2-polyprenyl-3-methyl-5-hydroxy-6-metoxy-1,4-benzoquinol methylase